MIVIKFLSLIVSLFLSALFSSAETAYTSLSPIQIEALSEKKGRRGKKIANAMKRGDYLLTTLLIGNNLTNIGAATLVTLITIELWGIHLVGIASGALTLFILIFGEVTPKRVALKNNEATALLTIDLVNFLSILFFPLIKSVLFISSLLSRISDSSREQQITTENLLRMVRMAESLGTVERYEKEMIRKVFLFSDTPIQAIMTHRKEVFSLDGELSLESAFQKILKSRYSRIPIYLGSQENIKGVILAKEAIKHYLNGEGTKPLKKIAEAALFIPQTWKLNQGLSLFHTNKLNLAIVLDEFGGLAGIVSTEDILEAVFGELYDENETANVGKAGILYDGSWILQGDILLSDMANSVNISINEESEDAFTLNGYLLQQLEEIPEEGKIVTLPEGRYTVEKVEKNRITRVKFVPFKEKE